MDRFLINRQKTQRKSLAEIQPYSDRSSTITPLKMEKALIEIPKAEVENLGNVLKSPTKFGSKKKEAVIPVYEDPPCIVHKPQLADVTTQTVVPDPKECTCSCHADEDPETTAYRLMCQEEVPEDYWKIIAERRREALNDSLQENAELHEEINRLKEENAQLTELASQADYFASVLKKLTDGDDSGFLGDQTAGETSKLECEKEDESTGLLESDKQIAPKTRSKDSTGLSGSEGSSASNTRVYDEESIERVSKIV